MFYSHWPTGDYPILINPSPEEYEKITSQRWDSLRIMVDSDDIGIASGLGNTHNSVQNAMRKVLDRHLHAHDYIFYVADGRVYSNEECFDGGSGRNKVPVNITLDLFKDQHADILRDIITETGYSLY